MHIKQVHISQFRNLHATKVEVDPHFNVFFGENGAGKTSFLEAIYYLGLGRSFRSHLINRIVMHGTECFTLFAEIIDEDRSTTIGIERSRTGGKRVHINGEPVQSLSELAKLLPLQFISTSSYRYFHDGSKPRRQFLDWGVFHVKHTFFSSWQRLQLLLKQRNAGLKSYITSQELEVWDNELIPLAEEVDVMRRQYIFELQPIINELFASILPDYNLSLRYSRGWNKEKALRDVLAENLHRDRQLGYTQSSPQRADLQLYCGATPVHDVLSQGQQKLASYVLHLAQGILFKKLTTKNPIYLIDDLPSELDAEKRFRTTEILHNLNAQVFLTGIMLPDLEKMIDKSPASLFHVKQGEIHNNMPSTCA